MFGSALKSLAVFVVAIVFGPIAAVNGAERVALVIGCGQYRVSGSELPTPPQDARSVARLLASPELGFAVVGGKEKGAAVIDPTRDDFFAALDTFKTQARQARVAVIYYSGHGIEEDGQNYLIPVDAELDSASQLRSQAVALRSIMEDLGTTGAEAKVVILDCCRNNPFRTTRAWARSRGFRDEVLAELGAAEIPEGTAVLYSTGPGRKAADRLDDKAVNSPFTVHLLTELSRPGQSALTAFGNIETFTRRDTTDRQIPRTQLSGSLGVFQSVVFVPGAVAPRLPVEETAPPTSPEKMPPESKPAPSTGQTGPPVAAAKPNSTSKPEGRSAEQRHQKGDKNDGSAGNAKPKAAEQGSVAKKHASDPPSERSSAAPSTHGGDPVRQAIETQYRRGQITKDQYLNALRNL